MENLEKQNLLVTIRGQQELQSSHSDDLEPFQHLLCGSKKGRMGGRGFFGSRDGRYSAFSKSNFRPPPTDIV